MSFSFFIPQTIVVFASQELMATLRGEEVKKEEPEEGEETEQPEEIRIDVNINTPGRSNYRCYTCHFHTFGVSNICYSNICHSTFRRKSNKSYLSLLVEVHTCPRGYRFS